MKRLLFIISLIILTLTGCQKQDEVVTETPSPKPEPEKDYVLADLALSIPASSASTRLSEDVVQTDVSKFRGIQRLSITPFSKVGEVGLDDKPTYFESITSYEDLMATNLAAMEHWLYYEKVYLMRGIGSFLTYGRPPMPDNPTNIDKETKGSLLTIVDGKPSVGIPERLTVSPSSLSFELDPIYSETALADEASFLADYLTQIAEARVFENTWKDYDDEGLHNLYEDFINKDKNDLENDSYNIIAGSEANVKSFVKAFYEKLSDKLGSYENGSMPQRIIQAIQDRMMNYSKGFGNRTLSVKPDGEGGIILENCNPYPGCLGLPDGAAVLLWAEKENGKYGFVPQTETSPMANICSINRYVYPAELYYYANSPILTSNDEVLKTSYTGDWNNVLSQYVSGPSVTSNTKAVAMVKPMQYAVACLSASVQSTSADPSILKAKYDKEVPVDRIPITGIIISGQNPVGYDFIPETVDIGEDHERFIYDCHLNEDQPLYFSTTTPNTYPIHTLLLQTKESEDVTVILELRNDSGEAFESEMGVIYPGTKFYLVGKMKLSGLSDEQLDSNAPDDVKKRVFTKDYTTFVNMKVNTLVNAFNVMPNVQADRLQVSIEMDLKWIQTEPTNVELTEEGDGD